MCIHALSWSWSCPCCLSYAYMYTLIHSYTMHMYVSACVYPSSKIRWASGSDRSTRYVCWPMDGGGKKEGEEGGMLALISTTMYVYTHTSIHPHVHTYIARLRINKSRTYRQIHEAWSMRHEAWSMRHKAQGTKRSVCVYAFIYIYTHTPYTMRDIDLMSEQGRVRMRE